MLSAVWLIPALPLCGVLVLALFGRRLGEPLAGWVATTFVAGSFVAGVVTWIGLLGHDEEHRQVVFRLFTWISVGSFSVDVGFLVDPLSITWVLFVTFVGALIHLYSISYMHGDDRFGTFFCYLNLFVFSMLVLVLGDNLVLTFLGWEGVGACSYLLISFWFQRDAAATAGKKAFVTNRIGDWGFMTAMFLLFWTLGTLTYVGGSGGGLLSASETLTTGTATAVALLLFVAAAGKSAQFPLFVWLPDAMEGPTPVSALIHAATMVTAGIYLLARLNPVLHLAPSAGDVIAVVGAFTALFAATAAVAQRDIKKVLAYSTVSQLGYMFLAIGTGAYVAAIFHTITHAFFKALLFLGAGSAIHALDGEQDMRRMGALRAVLPITATASIIGWLAIAGVPPFEGFFSKDEILAVVWQDNPGLWFVGLLTALLTAYYMSRQVFLVFFGHARWDDPAHGSRHPHESPALMTIPLIVLGGLSIVGGLINLPGVETLGHFLEPVFGERELHLTVSGASQVALAAVAVVVAVVGILIARRLYLRDPVALETGEHPSVEPELLRRAWGVDGAFSAFFGGPGRRLALAAAAFDRSVIDGAVRGTASVVQRTGQRSRVIQSGLVRRYALGIVVGAVVLMVVVAVGA